VIGVTGFSAERSDVRIHGEQILRIDIPPTVTEEHLEQMRNDLRVLSGVVAENPQAVMNIQNAVLRNDMVVANDLARSVGLTEENMVANGGGMWGYILVAAVVIGAYAAFSHPSGSPPEEHHLPADAGTG
jgi:hypothetical protein